MRDHLANQRTFLAWIRTSVTIVALGFVVANFGILLREIGGTHVHSLTARAGTVIGILLVIGGVVMIVLATAKYLRTRHDIDQGLVAVFPALDVALAIFISVISIVLVVYIVVTA